MKIEQRYIGDTPVYPVGLGCMNLNHAYGDVVSPEDGAALLRKALDLGYTLFDTATIYGLGRNEKLIGDTLKERRGDFTLSSKCVLDFGADGKRFLDARPETVKAACDASLSRLQTDVIDLYYLHRPDPNVPIEDSMGAMAELVQAGKIRMIGLSEMSADEIRRAQAVHPVSAVQSEYSLMTRNPEIAVLDTCRELDIAFVAFSPVGRGFFSDVPLNPACFAEKDMRRVFPRFSEAHFKANQALVEQAGEIARGLDCTVAQLSLAWVLAQGQDIIPIPGTVRQDHLEENITSVNIQIDDENLTRLNDIFRPEAISGPRYTAAQQATVTTEQYPFEAA